MFYFKQFLCILGIINCVILLFIEYKINNVYNRKTIKLLNYFVKNSGCFIIKITQWIITKLDIIENINLKEIFDEFILFYEKCPEHSFEETERIFNEYGLNINELFIELDKKPIASGTIGQVYQGIYHDGTKVAIKVRHPNIENDCWLPTQIILIYDYLFKNIYFFRRYSIPLDFADFFEEFNLQIDFGTEGKHLDRFNNNFKDNHLVIFPKHIVSRKKILVMTFEEGEYFENLNISEYKKYKIILTFNMMMRQFCIIDYFVHCDLHPGNWKVRKYNNEYQLVILDVGLSLLIKNKLGVNLMYKGKEYQNNNMMIDAIFEFIKNKNYCLEFKNEIKNEFNELYSPSESNSFMGNIKILIHLLSKRKIILSSELISVCICFSLADNLFRKYGFYRDDGKSFSIDEYLKKEVVNYISFCNRHNCFVGLNNHFKKQINDEEITELFKDY